jgi:CheY-like chemotaxis protein
VPHTLLLADDSVTIQRVIELTFADEDVTVVAVGDGDQAIERLEASPPDIVLADIGMPGKSGYEVAQYIRKSPRLEHIPVVLLTGAFEPVDQARAADAKCDGVLAKPFEPQMVIGRVKELLGRPQRAAADHSAQLSSEAPGLDSAAASSRGWMVSAAESLAPDQTAPGTELGPSFGLPPTETQVNLAQADLNAYFDRLDNAFNRGAAGASDAAETAKSRDLPLQPPSSRADHPLTRQSQEAAPIGGIDSEQTVAHAPEPASAALAAPMSTHDESRLSVDESPAAHSQSSEPETPPEPVAESRPVESRLVQVTTTSAAERIFPIEPMQIAPVAPALAAPPSAPGRTFPLKNPAPVPPLADAFAALLAAEQGAATPAVSWPASSSAVTVSDATIEAITRRVLDRLSDAVVRQTVSDIVSTIAERLAREEIERIKASIK